MQGLQRSAAISQVKVIGTRAAHLKLAQGGERVGTARRALGLELRQIGPAVVIRIVSGVINQAVELGDLPGISQTVQVRIFNRRQPQPGFIDHVTTDPVAGAGARPRRSVGSTPPVVDGIKRYAGKGIIGVNAEAAVAHNHVVVDRYLRCQHGHTAVSGFAQIIAADYAIGNAMAGTVI